MARRRLTISTDKVLRLDRPKQPKRKTASMRLTELIDVLKERGFRYDTATYGAQVTFYIPEVVMADTERWRESGGHGVRYKYTWEDFSCTVKLSTPVDCRPRAGSGLMTDGGFEHPEHGGWEEVRELYGQFKHPHFSGDGSMCLAIGWGDEFKNAIDNENWHGLIDSVIASISQYAASNPYRHLPHENPYFWRDHLSSGGSDFDDDFLEDEDHDYWDCEWCGSNHYRDSHWSCDRCGSSICESCSISCVSCDEYLCESCAQMDDDSEDWFCSSCYEAEVLSADCDCCGSTERRTDLTLCSCWDYVCNECLGECARCGANVCENCAEEVDEEDEDGEYTETITVCRRCS